MAKSKGSGLALVDSAKQMELFTITPRGMTIKPKLTIAFDQWEDFGYKLKTVHGALQFCLGDWLAYGEDGFGEQHSQALDHTGWDPKTISNYANVCRAIEFKRRVFEVSFSHYACVYKLDPADQDRLLKRAQDEGLTEKELRDLVRGIKKIGDGQGGNGGDSAPRDFMVIGVKINVEHKDTVYTELNTLMERGLVESWDVMP